MTSIPSLAALSLWAALAPSPRTAPAPEPDPPGDVPVDVLVVPAPCGLDGGLFGEAVCVLDWNGDDHPDLAVGAPGEGAVHLFFGTGDGLSQGLSVRFSASGLEPCGQGAHGDGFGTSLAALRRPSGREALVVGAPLAEVAGTANAGAVYVITSTHGSPTQLVAPGAGAERLGYSLAVADLDGDGRPEIAAGAPLGTAGGVLAGVVRVFPASGQPFTLENPTPVENGNYGHALAIADLGSDGLADLCVSAVGNEVDGVPKAGEVFVYPGPLGASPPIAVHAPVVDPEDLPSPRFGMHVAASGPQLLVGAPREDVGPIHDGGAAHFFGLEQGAEHLLFTHPDPRPADLFGFRVLLADFVGGPEDDAVVALLANRFANDPNVRALWVFDIAAGTGAQRIRGVGGSSDHFVNGCVAAELFGGGRPEIVTGDPLHVPPTGGRAVGRVVVFRSL